MPFMPKKPTSGSIWRPKYHRPDGSIAESKIWWITYWVDGKRRRESAETDSWEKANRKLKGKNGDAVTGRSLSAESVPMSTLFNDLVQDYIVNGRKSLYDVKLRLNAHLLPAFGAMRAIDVTATRAKRYVELRREAGAANATINRELSIVRSALAIGAKADPPLVLRVPHIPKLAEHNTREGFLDKESYHGLRDELPTYLRLPFVIAYHLGIRKGELLALKWAQVDFDNGQIHASRKTTKNGDPHTLPIYGEMRAWLDMAKSDRDADYVACQWVCSDHGVQIQSFRKAWASACKRAGVAGLLFHDLRRSAARNMDIAGVPRPVIMAITGHKTESMFLRYRIVASRDLKDAGIRMDQWMKSEQPKGEGQVESECIQ